MIVLDASAAVELLGDTQAGKKIAARLSTERILHAPHLLDLEVASAAKSPWGRWTANVPHGR